jgi:uncharacterized membrane-anchored protein
VSTQVPAGTVRGIARAGRRTKDLIARLRPGDIALIDHADLDRVAAEGLRDAGVRAVVNAQPSITGRYPNTGPLLLAAAGVVVIDSCGPDLLDVVPDGAIVRLVGGEIRAGDAVVATGRVRELAELEEQVEETRRHLGDELQRFATNTLSYLQQEEHLATDAPVLPSVRTTFRGRHALVVVRGQDYRADLRALKRSGYLREVRPVMVGVDGGADALLELGFKPAIVIGDFDSVSEGALRCGAELIVHAYPDGRAPGASRLDALGLSHERFELEGTSEDIAMLLAYELDAELIVAVGTHNSMEEFLDKGRAGMASTFLVRLRVGRILVDVKGVNRLYRPVVRRGDAFLLGGAMLLALVAVTLINEPLRLWLRSLWALVRSAVGG